MVNIRLEITEGIDRDNMYDVTWARREDKFYGTAREMHQIETVSNSEDLLIYSIDRNEESGLIFLVDGDNGEMTSLS